MINRSPDIRTLEKILLAGCKTRMSFSNNKTGDLWRRFMPQRSAIPHRNGPELYSVEIYDSPAFFSDFDLRREFEKWAAVRVSQMQKLPTGMDHLTIPGGLYAVFQYKGLAADAMPFYQAIYNTWLPGSGFVLDQRPHFARMGEKYKNDDPGSEEEIWVPVRKNCP